MIMILYSKVFWWQVFSDDNQSIYLEWNASTTMKSNNENDLEREREKKRERENETKCFLLTPMNDFFIFHFSWK